MDLQGQSWDPEHPCLVDGMGLMLGRQCKQLQGSMRLTLACCNHIKLSVSKTSVFEIFSTKY